MSSRAGLMNFHIFLPFSLFKEKLCLDDGALPHQTEISVSNMLAREGTLHPAPHTLNLPQAMDHYVMIA